MGIERAYNCPINDKERLELLVNHLPGFLEIADKNGKDILIKREGDQIVVYYSDRI